MKGLCACLLALMAVAPVQAQILLSRYRSYKEAPPILDHAPDAMPESAVLPVGMYDPSHPWDRPVVRVDGAPVRRPLFRSVVADPADRELILRDYRENGFALTPFQLAGDFKRYQRAQFHEIDALRDLRLQKEYATLEDYRRFVAEEIKLTTMLYYKGRAALTPEQRATLLHDYVANLRHKAIIEKISA